MSAKDHRQLATPNWDTKIKCGCGEQFVSRCEWALHVVRELGLDLEAQQ